MRSRLLLSALLTLLFQVISAQTTKLDIFLKSGSNDSLPNATLQIYSLPDSLLTLSKIGSSGQHIFYLKSHSKYLVSISAIGYYPESRSISLTDKAFTLTVTLRLNSSTLNTVTIVSQKPLMKQ